MTVRVALNASAAPSQVDATVRLTAQAAEFAVTSARCGQTFGAAHAFYEQIPSYARAVELSGGRRAADLAVIGDEKTVEAEVRRYRDAGATEAVFSAAEIAGEADRRRTWRILGEPAG